MLVEKRGRTPGEIPTAAMPDIVFMLLIFFLVTTTINQDKGINLALPAWGDQKNVPKSNICNVLINASGLVMVAGEEVQMAFIKDNIEKRLAANDKLIISIKYDPATEYEKFIEVLDQVKLANAKKISIAEPDK